MWHRSLVAGLCLMTTAAAAMDRDPTGERAYYQLDRNRNRTSSMISGGEMTASVESASSMEYALADRYRIRLDYKIDTYVSGRQEGTETMTITAEYFSQAFLERLRVEKYYETPEFKVEHIGFGDAHNMDGRHYANCDKLRFYDMKTTHDGSTLVPMVSGFEDLEIVAHVKFGFPVLGAVKLDVSGNYSGMSMKAGADYRP